MERRVSERGRVERERERERERGGGNIGTAKGRDGDKLGTGKRRGKRGNEGERRPKKWTGGGWNETWA